ncbi:hypothetical protein GHK86_08980, partial [Acidimicrobiaceae bacterium USS-CC1]|nr:hypothetical protein [Acidiferrimicrobium australe]
MSGSPARSPRAAIEPRVSRARCWRRAIRRRERRPLTQDPPALVTSRASTATTRGVITGGPPGAARHLGAPPRSGQPAGARAPHGPPRPHRCVVQTSFPSPPPRHCRRQSYEPGGGSGRGPIGPSAGPGCPQPALPPSPSARRGLVATGTLPWVSTLVTATPLRAGGDARGPHGARRWLVLPVAYLVGSVPFANLAATRTRGVDLRTVGTGTVSGTGLFAVAGFRVLAVAGVLE